MEATDSSLSHRIGATRAEVEATIRRQVDTIRDADARALDGLAAALTLPLTGAAMVLLGVAQVTLASTDEAAWDALFRKEPAGPPDEVTP